MASVRLPPLPTIQDIIQLYRLSARKQLSQNFLLDQRLTDKLVRSSGKIYNSQVLEIGPGPGTITRSIIRNFPKKLIVIEKDKRFKPTLDILKDVFSANNSKMDIIINDVMHVNMQNLIFEEKKNWYEECPNIYLIGNLPFSISTTLIIKWLHDISEKRNLWSNGRVQMTLTFQKEVAERIVAQATENQRCRLSIIAQAWTVPKLQFIIPNDAFVPKPDVDVGVVSFTPLKKPRTNHEFQFFEKVNRHLFSFRQKYSIKCARTLFPPDCEEQLSSIMYKLADVNPKSKAFDLTVEDVSRLASAYQYLCNKHSEIQNYNYRASRRILSRKLTKSITVKEYSEGSNY